MPAILQRKPVGGNLGSPEISAGARIRDVDLAARWLARAEAAVGLLALGSFSVVFLRLFERWRVTPDVVSHRVSILGQKLTYPAANLAALLLVGLAVLGLVALALAGISAIEEVRAARDFTRRLALSRPLAATGAFLIEDARPDAFCAGLLHPRVYVTTGALELLDHEALGAVLAHEGHHVRRRDPLRLLTSRVLARAMYFLPGVAELGRRRETLAEISADQSAIRAGTDTRPALARAMLDLSDGPASDRQVRVDPARVDHLLGVSPSWGFPALALFAALFAVVLLGAVAVLVGQEAAGSASLAPPFLAARPCVVVLALIPAGLGLAGIAVARRRRRGTPTSTTTPRRHSPLSS